MKEFLHENESKQNICFSLQIVDKNYSDLKLNLELKAKLKFERINHTLYLCDVKLTVVARSNKAA